MREPAVPHIEAASSATQPRDPNKAPGVTPLLTHPPACSPHPVPSSHVEQAPPRTPPAHLVVPLPRVRPPAEEYPFTNDKLFGTSDILRPVPTLPPVLDLPFVANPECILNPPPTTAAPPAHKPPTREFVYAPAPVRTDVPPEKLGIDEDGQGSVGAGIQLLAVGPQNYVLDINPQMTFFKAVYKRHTDFASETFEDAVALRPGTMTSVEIPRRGDMLGGMYLQVQLPDLGIPGGSWADAIGYVLLSRVRLAVDDVVVHDHERLWYDLVDRVFMPHGKLRAIDALIGRGASLPTDRAHTVHVPFKFFFCPDYHASRQVLPLAALSRNARLVLELSVEAIDACLVLPPGTPAPTLTFLHAKVLSDQIFVEQDEQRAAWQKPWTLMIESPQDIDSLSYEFSVAGGSHDLKATSLDLRELNLPVKSLVFVAYDENATSNKQYFRYLDVISSGVLYINSSQRFSPRPGAYFSLVQTYQHAGRCTPDNVHMYSFALHPAERQPSGALNFAVVEKPYLRVEFSEAAAGLALKVKAFAQCVNWLVIKRGGLALRYAT